MIITHSQKTHEVNLLKLSNDLQQRLSCRFLEVTTDGRLYGLQASGTEISVFQMTEEATGLTLAGQEWQEVQHFPAGTVTDRSSFLKQFDVSVEPAIKTFFHCKYCMLEKPDNVSAREYGSLEIGLTASGSVQVWCKRHECLVAELSFKS